MTTNNTQVDIEYLLQRLREANDILLRARTSLSVPGGVGNDHLDYLQDFHDISIVPFLQQIHQIENQINGLPDRDYFLEPIVTAFNSFRDLAQQLERIIRESREAPTDREAVERLSQIIIAANHFNAEAVCPICTEPFQLGDDARQMPCHEAHIFHARCLLPWLERRNSCPICRARLLTSMNASPDSVGDAFDVSTTSNNG
ncbi:probable E3 ubiquitin-protein ligase RHC1A [Cryptomeria japonica]|uniref:probable E3 ubiquitin-protein ligase RHC1A n=1 Tax=Cryptomeria japonica TaxID=3369 RepID=UPI0027DA86C4|nr:probable E3 ubiquitin-protein ligase RHC1A [Cryptomeria japonica]